MNITNKTALITGGGSGIGLEIAKTLIEKGNKVIITGRNEAKLQKAVAGLKNTSAFAGDINNADDVDKLVEYLNTNHSTLDVVINNAGQASAYHLSVEADAFEKAGAEIQTNYLSVIRLTEKLLHLLSKQPEAAIVNVTSIVVFAPNAFIPTYAASKAALHSYTQTLRFTLAKTTAIKVFELFPPLVDTEFSKEIGGSNGIPPSAVAEQFVKGFENDQYEIHVGATADIYKLFLSSPEEAFKALNQERGNG
ncbi:SDR family oxidoreductase [Mucilaginibacter paludis]|uniref:Short-chain dehydrogenase/reductase SDR n=1 Tax=Mucilaginibacter paludis DSM 18603 TaxID=714943 RepID=H1Y2Q1_9SPHI|nr:SDR family NAD(P)-dependent oxidoreductase [Mucilaginibacter paludis]EHQ28230.1 short-chain dehydrogenase/reductase SDR [Mucilaginibacter paludis DSM 18603]